jgi:hypothetical protein
MPWLAREYGTQLRANAYSDADIRLQCTDGRGLMAHTLVLRGYPAFFSAYFAANKRPTPETPAVIEMQHPSRPVGHILDYMYMGRVPRSSPRDLIELLVAADYYSLTPCIDAATRSLMDSFFCDAVELVITFPGVTNYTFYGVVMDAIKKRIREEFVPERSLYSLQDCIQSVAAAADAAPQTFCITAAEEVFGMAVDALLFRNAIRFSSTEVIQLVEWAVVRFPRREPWVSRLRHAVQACIDTNGYAVQVVLETNGTTPRFQSREALLWFISCACTNVPLAMQLDYISDHTRCGGGDGGGDGGGPILTDVAEAAACIEWGKAFDIMEHTKTVVAGDQHALLDEDDGNGPRPVEYRVRINDVHSIDQRLCPMTAVVDLRTQTLTIVNFGSDETQCRLYHRRNKMVAYFMSIQGQFVDRRCEFVVVDAGLNTIARIEPNEKYIFRIQGAVRDRLTIVIRFLP